MEEITALYPRRPLTRDAFPVGVPLPSSIMSYRCYVALFLAHGSLVSKGYRPDEGLRQKYFHNPSPQSSGQVPGFFQRASRVLGDGLNMESVGI